MESDTMTETVPCPFAYEFEANGNRVRLEAPTEDGLMSLMKQINPMTLLPEDGYDS